MLSVINKLKKHKIARSLLSVVLAITVLCSALSMVALIPAFAEYDIWDGSLTAPSTGLGTQDSPIEISNGAELAYVIVNGGGANTYYKLTSDIYLNNVDKINWSTGVANTGYTPNSWYEVWQINNRLNGSDFQGTIDGDGHVIYGLYYNENPTSYSNYQEGAALIPRVKQGGNATILNLGMDNVYVHDNTTAAAFVGVTMGVGTTLNIDSCFVGANATLKSANAGAFRGYSRDSGGGSVTNCYSFATTVSALTSHGLMAYNWESVANSMVISNCFNANGPISTHSDAYYYVASENNYESVAGVLTEGVTTVTVDNMKGLDVFTDAAKMPTLNSKNAYVATEDYPVLSAFVEDSSGEYVGAIWDGETETKPQGEGTEASPYLISNGAELAWAIANGGGANEYYKLTADIYLNDITKVNWTTGEGVDDYTPNAWYDNYAFEGIIDGNGHVVYGLYFQTPKASTAWGFYGEGLIPHVEAGKSVKVTGLGIEYAYISSENGASAFVGFAGTKEATDYATVVIDQCYVGASVLLKGNDVGAFRGGTYRSNTTITNSYSLATLNGTSTAGLIGNHWTVTVAIENSYNANGAITSDNWLSHIDSGLKNVYATDTGVYVDAVKEVSAANMTGLDVFENADKMPNLNAAGKFLAVDNDYPILVAFTDPVAEGVWDGETETKPQGEGTEASPYLISNGAELAWAIANGGGANEYYKLTADIYLNDIDKVDWTTGEAKNGYEIRDWYDNASFEGIIDGNGKVVYGLYFRTTKEDNVFFGYYGEGLIPRVDLGKSVKITGLGIDCAFVSGQNGASAFVGVAGAKSGGDDVSSKANVTIDQCYVGEKVTLRGHDVGAFRGATYGSATTITNSYSLATLVGAGDGYTTGLIGNIWSVTVAIENCYNAKGAILSDIWNGHIDSGLKNVYATDAANYPDAVKEITEANMIGEDALTSATKMPNLNTNGKFVATTVYPVLDKFVPKTEIVTGPWNGEVTAPTEGDGTRKNPYLIGTAEELAYIIKNGGNGKYYKLTADIYLNDTAKVNWATGEGIDGYVPQGWYDNASFEGTIDGDGHVVYGLYFKTPNPSVSWGFYGEGLIPRVDLGKSVTVSNLGVDYAYISSQNGASAFVGFAGGRTSGDDTSEKANVTVKQCYVGENVTLIGNDVGAFRGGTYGSSTTISNAYSLATLNGASTAGLIGNHWSATASISNAFNATGKITSDRWLSSVVLDNVYAPDKGAYVDDVIALTADNMKGADALTSDAKMPALNKEDAFIATEGYPVLKVFSGIQDDTVVETPGQVWTGAIANDFAEGEGTAGDPFIISTAAELAYAVKNNGFAGKYFKLSHDIYLNDITNKLWYLEDTCNAWFAEGAGFDGHIDGDGHIVYGLWYPDNTTNETSGLIPAFMKGSIKNLGVRNAQVNAVHYAGGIVGKTVRYGEKVIDSCFVDETVYVTTGHIDSGTGGIVGMAYDTTNAAEVCLTITNSYSKARLVGIDESRKNGILGGSWRTPYSIENCYSIGYPVYTADSAAECTSAYWNYYPVAETDPNYANEARPGVKLSDFIKNNYCDTGVTNQWTAFTVVKNSESLRGTAAKSSMPALDYTKVFQTVDGGTPKLKIFTSIDGKDIVSSKEADFFGEGIGTQKDPFIIKTVEHLRYVVESVDTKGKYYQLGNDIYVNNTKNSNWMKNNPVEWYTVKGGVGFAGNFDGAGYKIYGLYKNDTPIKYLGDKYTGEGKEAEWQNIGTALFPYVAPTASIRNVHIRDSYLVGEGTVGAIAGNCMNGSESARLQFIACSVDESVTLKGFTVGGILGASHSRGVDLTYCYSTAKMSNTGPSNRLSGLVGDIWSAKLSALESYTDTYQVTFGSLVNTTALYSPVEQFGVTVLTKANMTGANAKNNMNFTWGKVWYTASGKTPQLKVVPYGAEESLYDEGVKGRVWSGKISTGFAGGDGTKNNPYLIYTPEQMARIFAVQSSEFTYYKLMADLKLNDTSRDNWEDTAKMWYAGNYVFRGVFDGNGHVVSGLYYKNENNNDNAWAGLFQAIGHSSTIKRVGVTESTIINKGPNVHSYAAAICAYLEHWRDRGYENPTAPVISECFGDDSVYIEATAAAGILAATQTAVTIENCYFTGELTGSLYAAAMVADNWAASGYGPTIKNCYGATFDGDPLGDGYGTGAFNDDTILNEKAFITNCYVAGASLTTSITPISVMYMKGHDAKDYLTGFDYNNVWMTCENGTPVLRCFKNAAQYASTRNPKQVQISFGNLGTAVVEPIYGYPGYTPISADELPIPQRRGFIFNGWHHFNPDGAEFELTLFPNYDITLYANWTEVGFTQNFDKELDEKYDYNEGIEIFKPGLANYDTKYVHSGWRSLHTLADSAVDPEFLVSYEDTLLVGYEYEITFWMTTDVDGTSGKLYFEQSNWGDVNDEIVGYEEVLSFTGLTAGEWKQYTVKIIANAPYLIVRAEKGTSLFFEDFEAIPTGAKGELGNLIGYTPNSVGNEPGANGGIAPWALALIIGGAVVVIGGATVLIILLAKKKKKAE